MTGQQLRGRSILVPSSETERRFHLREMVSPQRVNSFQMGRPDQRQSGYAPRRVHARAAHVADETGFGTLSEPQHSLRSLAKRSSGRAGRSRHLTGWWGPSQGVSRLRDPRI